MKEKKFTLKTILIGLLVQNLLFFNLTAWADDIEDIPFTLPEGASVLPWPKDYPIPVFESPASDTPTNYIVQSAIEDHLYIGIVIDDSLLRFKAFFYIENCTSGWYSESWIDKTFLAIFPKATFFDKEIGYYYLVYTTPLKEEYSIVPISKSPEAVQPLEFVKQQSTEVSGDTSYLAKVALETDSGIVVGWIDQYSVIPNCDSRQ